MGRVDLFAGFELDGADFEDVLGALVQQMNDLLIKLVDGFAVNGEAHGWRSLNSSYECSGFASEAGS